MSDDAVSAQLNNLRRTRVIRQVAAVLLILGIVATTVFGLGFIGFDLGEIRAGIPGFVDFIGAFFPPNFGAMTVYTKNQGITGLQAIPASLVPSRLAETLASPRLTLVKASIVTLLLGFLGTVLGFLPALVFGVLGSEQVTPFPFNFIFRGTMSAIRAIPAIVWIFLFIPFGPPSQATAVLAIATDTIGNLGRLFTDELEEVDEGPIEAIRSTGASRTQTVGFGMLSQVSRSFIAWTLYILEINTRIAISLGVVGAGGLGLYIRNQQDLLQFQNTAAGIVMVFIVVLSIELLSSRIRARLRPSEHESKGFVEGLKDLLNADKWVGRSKDA
ncbi:PhnE/PtxC family ABC transporter permease [Haloarcula litorea]|uniref:PhnE/PtxC family ABC transporter permease n=1 Tax=Haloarcula litorea TaxID=3032579 RepID=UPI0023E86DB1|nr:phosphate/phosphonate ABC transporter permease [Halomicroarcula sp. GDY20]